MSETRARNLIIGSDLEILARMEGSGRAEPQRIGEPPVHTGPAIDPRGSTQLACTQTDGFPLLSLALSPFFP